MITFLIILGIILVLVFILSFKENAKHESLGEAAKSGAWSVGVCLVILFVFAILLGQCISTFDSDSSLNRKLNDPDYDHFDDTILR